MKYYVNDYFKLFHSFSKFSNIYYYAGYTLAPTIKLFKLSTVTQTLYKRQAVGNYVYKRTP
ncbi:hypothetical protein, partial [Lysinibacillus xylanilyticus]